MISKLQRKQRGREKGGMLNREWKKRKEKGKNEEGRNKAAG